MCLLCSRSFRRIICNADVSYTQLIIISEARDGAMCLMS